MQPRIWNTTTPVLLKRRPVIGGEVAFILSCLAASTLVGAGAAVDSGHPLIKLRGIGVRPHLQYTGNYSEGVLVRPGQPASSYIESFAPGIRLDLGKKWTFDYTPTWTSFSNAEFKNSLDHAASLTGSKTLFGLGFSFSQGYSNSSSVRVETGKQTTVETLTTSIGTSYPIMPKLSFVTAVSQALNFVPAVGDTFSWTMSNSLEYQWTTRTVLSTGVSSTYSLLFSAPDMLSLSPYIGLTWRSTEKLSTNLQLSIDERKTLESNSDWIETPTYSASVSYKIFEQTSVSVSANRTVAPSLYLKNQLLVSTGWSLGLSQRLLGHLNLNVGVSGQDSGYPSARSDLPDTRDDNSLTYTASLGMSFLRRGSVSINYQQSENTSNQTGFNYNSHTIGAAVGYRY